MGKTTTAINLAAGLASNKKKVLLIDLDPQGNATMGSGVDKNDLESNVYHVLIAQVGINDAVVSSETGAYDVLASNRELSGADIDLMELEDREYRLKNAIAELTKQYDFILIDCPPTLSLLTINALAAADGVIIPCLLYTSDAADDIALV